MGDLIYQGPSRLDGSPIVAVASCVDYASGNGKTGDMVQVYILSALDHPVEAYRNGTDASICGDCPLHAVCYVELGKAPAAVFRSWRAGTARPWVPRPWHKPVRLGAYGDPAALPPDVLRRIIVHADKGWTGYTHQWKRFPALRRWLMASCEDLETYREAKRLGFRAFTATDEGSLSLGLECPNATHGVQCADCGLCSGSMGPADPRADIWIPLHGAKAKRGALQASR